MLTRIMHQISHIFDLNKIKNNFIFYLKRCAFREGTPFIHFQLTVSDPAFADPYSAHQWHRKTVPFSTLFPFYDVSYTATDIPAPTRNPFRSSAAEFLLFSICKLHDYVQTLISTVFRFFHKILFFHNGNPRYLVNKIPHTINIIEETSKLPEFLPGR